MGLGCNLLEWLLGWRPLSVCSWLPEGVEDAGPQSVQPAAVEGVSTDPAQSPSDAVPVATEKGEPPSVPPPPTKRSTRWDQSDSQWGSQVSWTSLDLAMGRAKASGRPVMVIVYKGICQSCKKLKSQMAESQEVAELSKGFFMVNMEDPEDSVPELRPVVYVPRILFFAPDGKLCEEFYNRLGNPKYKYYYPNVKSVVASMKDVLQKYPL